jgi:hypothetical protein
VAEFIDEKWDASSQDDVIVGFVGAHEPFAACRTAGIDGTQEFSTAAA